MNELISTLAERGQRYGDFTGHAEICQDLMHVMQKATSRSMDGSVSPQRPWDRLDPVKRQALTVIADKIARILNGDPNYTDNWHDIQGYARLAEERCSPQPGPDPLRGVPDVHPSLRKDNFS